MADGAYHLHIHVDRLPKMNTASSRRHWAVGAKDAKRWLNDVFGAIVVSGQNRPQKPLERASVAFTRHSTTQPDYTNLVAGFKPVEDALVKLRILEDDKPGNYIGGHARYLWEKAPKKKGHITIEVTG